MIQVPFSDTKRYRFAKYLSQSWKKPVASAAQDENQVVQVSHEILAEMLRKLDRNESCVLYYYHNNKCFWLLLDADEAKLDKLYASLRPFLIPSYLGGDETGGVPKRRRFTKGKAEMNDIGADLFPYGFYMFRSLEGDFEKILDALLLWDRVRRKKPQRLRENRPTYFELYQIFQDALQRQQWLEAEETLEKINRFSLSTADNIAFLRYILWGAQKKWDRIWENPDFREIGKLPMPRSVRGVMLSAFYYQVIQPLEERFGPQEIFQAYSDRRAQLGALLNGRFGEMRPEVLRVFAYQSAREQNYELFEDILSVCETPELINLLSNLESFFPQVSTPQEPATVVVEVLSPLEKARGAMMNADYDSALKAALQVEEGIDQCFLLMQIATHSGDLNAETIERAFGSYERLTDEQKETLTKRFPQSLRYLQFLENSVNDQAFPSDRDPVIAAIRNRAWNTICDLEIRLRKAIRARYMRQFGKNWIVSIDPNMIDRWKETKENDPFPGSQTSILDYSFLTDLSKLVFREWIIFKNTFGPLPEDRSRTRDQFDVLIAVRNSLAHNRFVPENSLKEAIDICRLFLGKIAAETN